MKRPARWIDPGTFDDEEVPSTYDDLCLWAAPFGLALLDTIRLRGVEAMLDVACGAGFPLLEIADRLGPSRRAVGLDPWRGGLERARRKALTRDLENVELVLGKAEQMPFPDATFDLIVSNNGLNNVADPERALSECARVARSGAQIVVTTNLPTSMRELYDVFEDVLKGRGRADLLPRVAAHIDHKRKPASVLAAWLEAAGFGGVRAEERSFRLRFADGTALFRHWFMRLGFIEAWASAVGPDEAEPVLDEIERRLNEAAAAAGEVALTIPFACIEATR
jgi:arsenite methyltransferase